MAPYEPEKGYRFNKAKLLVDPYAKAISGKLDWKAPVYGYKVETGDDLQKSDEDSAAGMPKCVVVDNEFDWGGDKPPGTPLVDSLLYEVHVKGFSKLNPNVPRESEGHLCRHGSSLQH